MRLVSIFLFLILGLFTTACNHSSKGNPNGKAKIEFKETNFDFGNIKQGEKVGHRFAFKNVGDGNLLIKDVVPGCGCTVANYPKTSVSPGDESFIEATFDSDGYRGLCIKEVDVYTNGQPVKVTLTISATVKPEDK